ncbi:2992_t:CDS:2, partial [Diversispora eburnea]
MDDQGSSPVNIDDVNLDPSYQKILESQVHTENYKASYLKLYTFATKKDWLIMFIGLIFSGLTGVTTPLLTVLFGKMIDYFTQHSSQKINSVEFTSEVNSTTLKFVYLGITTFFATYFYMAAWVYTGERIARQIRERYLRAILRQNIAYFDKIGAGEITTRITSDTHLVQDGISEKFAMAFQYFVQFIASFFIAFFKSWKMTLVICCLIPLVVITSGVINKLSSLYSKRTSDFYSQSGSIAEEAFSTIRTVAAFGAQKKLSKLYDYHLKDAKAEGKKKSIVNAFWYGSTLIIDGELTPGGVVNVFFAVIIGALSLGNIAPDIQSFSFATGASSKIFEAIHRVPSIDTESEEGEKVELKGHIQLKNISFIYPSRPTVQTLNNVTLDIEPGSTVALVGSSGSGKSTIVSLILRFYDPVAGEVQLDGYDIKSLNLKSLRRQISLVSQEPVLFNTTIAENVSHGLIGSKYENLSKDKKWELIENACKMANAHDFIMKLPEKYETMVGERGFLLSGGQKQRIAIARAIIKDPMILLLDEATSALDTQSEGIVQDALDKASKNRTTIVIAHRLSTIRNATKIIVMNQGSIMEIGNHGELMEKKGAYYNLVEAQQIQSVKESKHSSMTPPEDRDILLKQDIIPEEDQKLGRIVTNLSVSSAILSKRKADLEAGIKHDYEYTTWELIKKVGKINRPEIPLIILGYIAAIVCGSVYPTFAIIFSHIIESLSKPPDQIKHDATFWALMFLVIAVVILIGQTIQGVAFGYSGENLTERIRSLSFTSLLRQDIEFFDEERNSVGILTSSLSLDATRVNGLAGITFGTILQVVTTVIMGFIIGLAVGWKLTLACAVCIPLLIGSGAIRMKMLNGFQEKTKRAYEESAQIACEGAGNIRTVASLTREKDLWNIYHRLLDEPMKQGHNNAFYASVSFAFAQSVIFLANGLGFWYGSRLFRDGEYSINKMFTVFFAIIFGSMSAGRAFQFIPDIMKAKQSAASIISLIERNPMIDTWSKSGKKLENVQGLIEFKDVHFRYPTRPHIQVLQGLDLKVKPGQFAALVGPSGCGKSTTIGLTERFYQVTSGSVTIDGIDISTININNLRENIALVSQEPSLFDMTIKENIIFGCRPEQNPTQEDIERVCREANIYDFISQLPEGFDTQVGGKGTQLSGGQKQRIAIARALIRNPKILLLDEATSALDSQSEKVVQDALDQASKGRTTISIAHRLSTIQNADIIFVIKDGKVREQGTHQELLAQNGIYYLM